ncbi:MAG: hypothetical protein WAO00_11050 [Chthoniobacterales bacterium]
MTSALNLTLKIKQTPETLAKLQAIKAGFAHGIQQKIDAALRDSQIVHYARVLVIDDLYIQVITEFDGDKKAYTEFFRAKLPDVFATIFSLAENPPTAADLVDPDAFYRFSRDKNLSALGTDGLTEEDRGSAKDEGFFFCAYPSVLVKDILAANPPAGN